MNAPATSGRSIIPIDEIRAAARTIAGEAVVTPIMTSDELDAALGANVICKIEALQRAGSFKFRGAYNRLHHIPTTDRGLGVVAVSSGNHGAAVACAAGILGIDATVFIPDDAPIAKRSLIEHFGAEIVTFDRNTSDREAGARARVAETGATFVHPFEDPLVMAGQGTVGLELIESADGFDVLVVPMSGGGLMAGCGSAVRATAAACEIVGVEPALADDTKRSFRAGRRVAIDPPFTIADGLAVTSPGENTFSINRSIVDDVVSVTDDQIASAMALVFDTLGLVVEPSAAVGIAAIADAPDRWRDRRVAVIVSGGNVDADRFAALTGRDVG
jgi:threonine dehydratase